MTPSRSRRPRRSATAGEESPTRRPSSASVRRASAWSSASSRMFVASSAPSAISAFCRRFAGMSPTLPAISSVPRPVWCSSCGSMTTATAPAPTTLARRVPAHVWFVGSAVFHYLGPAFAVLLFARVEVLGAAWLRIASAAVVLGLWRRPWRVARGLGTDGRRLLLAWGAVLAVMNCCFYLAIDALPLGTVAAIEFLPVILLAALGARSVRNALALALAVPGVYLLTGVHIGGEPLGVALAFANAVLFALYIVLAHRVARHGAGGRHAAGGLGGDPGRRRPGRAARGRRRGHLLVGHPLHLRPARDGAPRARDLRADGVAAAGHGDRDRRYRAGAGPLAGGGARRGARHRGGRRPPR